MTEFSVSITPNEAADIVAEYVVNDGMSNEMVDKYSSHGKEYQIHVMVFEKYFMRNSSRASLTVTIENLRGITNVHAVGAGGGQGSIFNFDWGSAGDFERCVSNALQKYYK